jgi:hypothetical protein
MTTIATIDLSEYEDRHQNYRHYIGVATSGFINLPQDVKNAIVSAFMSTQKGDWFYAAECNGQRVFICENGEMGYTAMLPEEY